MVLCSSIMTKKTCEFLLRTASYTRKTTFEQIGNSLNRITNALAGISFSVAFPVEIFRVFFLIWITFLQNRDILVRPQQRYTCSKSVIETQGKGLKYVQNWQQKHQSDIINIVILNFKLISRLFLVFLSLPLSMFLFAGTYLNGFDKETKLFWLFCSFIAKICVKSEAAMKNTLHKK